MLYHVHSDIPTPWLDPHPSPSQPPDTSTSKPKSHKPHHSSSSASSLHNLLNLISNENVFNKDASFSRVLHQQLRPSVAELQSLLANHSPPHSSNHTLANSHPSPTNDWYSARPIPKILDSKLRVSPQ